MPKSRKPSQQKNSKKIRQEKKKGLSRKQIEKLEAIQANSLTFEQANKILNEKKNVPMIMGLLKYRKGAGIRINATLVLGEIGNSKVLPFLEFAKANDADENVRAHAHIAIQRIKSWEKESWREPWRKHLY